MGRKLVLIDGHSILNRAFYGVPDLSNSKGLHTNAIYGFLNILFKILEEEKPDFLAVAFDVHAPTFRHEMYAAYKGTRKSMPEELREQVPVMKELLRAMGIVMMEQAGLEADDILGTLARRAEAEGMDVSLVSGDRDLLQIATKRTKIRIPKTKKGHTEIEDYYEEDVQAAYQVTPAQFIELKALMGDASDNIPGVPKVGEKTAMSLMAEYGSLENIYAHLEDIPKQSIRDSLRENRELADLSKVLATIKTDCEIVLDYEAARAEGYFTREAYALFRQLEFKNYLSRFSEAQMGAEDGADAGKTGFSFRVLPALEELEAFLGQIAGKFAAGQPVGQDAGSVEGARAADADSVKGAWTAGDTDSAKGAGAAQEMADSAVGVLLAVEGSEGPGQRLLGAAISAKVKDDETTVFYRMADDEAALGNLLRAFSGRIGRLATFDIKPQYAYLSPENVGSYFDILIGAYLLNPLKSDYDLSSIAAEHLDSMVPDRAEVFGKQSLSEAFAHHPDKCAEYFCRGAHIARKAAALIAKKLAESGMARLMQEIEMPLSLVLYDMEKEGVLTRKEELKAYGEALASRILELEASIHRQAGAVFNINSPKQLGEVLFEKLGLPGGKKTKTGYSTAADVLEKLSEEHPIVKDILEYRGLAKLKSTYAEGLAAFIGADGRIHTNFNQTITATGRISSTEPNLQNIPMRMELGRRIRKVFVPREGCVFMDADYSQIELRLLAHMSGDEQLIDAYRAQQDIHRMTAAKVFHVAPDDVTDLQRRNAKAVNFGIVYGISSFGLSQDLSISRKEAAEYIEQYFATYPKVKAFLDALVAEAKQQGYVATLFGRRRPIPELSSSNFMQRSFGERVAMNSPLQGTAADIIKIAMILVWRALREQGLRSKLILQVHDELLVEVWKDEEEAVRKLLSENMRAAADLRVRLEVDLHTGENWYEAK